MEVRKASLQRSGIGRCGGFGLLSLLLLFFLASAQTYRNPVIPGDFPDPTVIRVGGDYYAAATTGNWAPHFPLLHSTDLVNWKIIGSVLTETPGWAKGDFWAPELTVDKGRYFVYYTARREEGKDKKGTLCVAVATATKPEGPYTDRGPLVCQEMGSIDAFFIRDENDKPFLIWKEDGNDRQQPTWLYAQQLDESGTKLIGKPEKLFRNTEPWENHVVEGSFIVRRNGWYYHFYSGNACCGRGCKYALGVARSKTLLGKWEKNPANPILDANETWQCPGHGSIVTTEDGRDYLLYHAYRNKSEGFNIGREALLDEIKYKNGWPVINDGRGPSERADVPMKSVVQKAQFELTDEFRSDKIRAGWSFPIRSKLNFLLRDNETLGLGGAVPLPTGRPSNEVVLAERTTSPDYAATARLLLSASQPDESAGISVYSWRGEAIGISAKSGSVTAWRRDRGQHLDLANVRLAPPVNSVQLRITVRDGEEFRFAASVDDGKSWADVGEKISKSDVEGARIALIRSGSSSEPGVRFDWLRVKPE